MGWMGRAAAMGLIGFLALFPARPAAAKGPESKPAGPCAADAARLCKNFSLNDPRVVTCLKKHDTKLSSVCRETIVATEAAAEAIRRDCKADAARVCPNVVPGQGRLVNCLMQHSNALSADCSAALNEIPSAAAKPPQPKPR
jgi:hypothetical protein